VYTDYWQLDERPFDASPARGQVFESPSLVGAQHKLRYAIEGRCEVAVLTGASGVGKTFLLDHLRSMLSANGFDFHTLRFPQLSPRELLSWIDVELGGTAATTTPAADHSLRSITKSLVERTTAGRHTVLVVDEAQLLEDMGLLETLRCVSNLCHEGRALTTLVLCGQPELLPMIARQPALAQRVAQVALLTPLDVLETRDYVRHRIEAAGGNAKLLTSDGIAVLHELTGGVPRLVNRLLDLALVVGFAEGAPHIDGNLLSSVNSELMLLRAA
jgi:general secretion pathway protein A